MKKPLLCVLVLAMSISLVVVFSSGGCGPAVSAGEEKPESEEALGLSEQPDKELFYKYFSYIDLGGHGLFRGVTTLLPHQEAWLTVEFKNKKNFKFRIAVLNLETNDFVERCATTASSEGSDGFGMEALEWAFLRPGSYEYRIYVEDMLVAALPFEVISYVDYFFGNSGEEPVIEEAEVEEVTGEPEEKALDESEAEEIVEESTKKGKIAFYSDRDGNLEIYIMNVDGSGQTRLTDNPAGDWNPFFLP